MGQAAVTCGATQTAVANALRHFRHRRHEVLLFHLLDDVELN